MSKTRILAAAKLAVGTDVRVKTGVTLPDLPDIPLGNWAGTISNIFVNQTPVTYEIKWNSRTLDDMPSIYRKRCERDGYEWHAVTLYEDELELNTGEALKMEQPTEIVTRPLVMNNQEDRIRAIFQLTTDDPLPDVEYDTLAVYYQYLVDQLSFPFQAQYKPEDRRSGSKPCQVTVRSLYDIDDYDAEECYGLIGIGLYQDKRIEFPIRDIDVKQNDPNRQLIDDYKFWMA